MQDAVQHAIQGAVWHTAQQNGSKAAMTTTQGAPTARLSEGMWLCGRRVSCAAAVPEQRSDGVGRPPRRRYRALGPTNAPRSQLQPLHCDLWTRRFVLGTGRDAVLSLQPAMRARGRPKCAAKRTRSGRYQLCARARDNADLAPEGHGAVLREARTERHTHGQKSRLACTKAGRGNCRDCQATHRVPASLRHFSD